MNTTRPLATREQKNPISIPAGEAYRIWSQTYDTDPNPLIALELRCLAHKLDHMAGKTLLDVACGTGRWMVAAAERGARAIGVDLSFEMLAVARAKPQAAFAVVQGDAGKLPFTQCADMVVCSFSLGYMPGLSPLMQELGRVARRGGKVLVTDLHPVAQSLGWKRSFRRGADVFEIECRRYSCAQLLAAGRRARLELREIVELRLGDPEREILRRAGKERMTDELSAVPAVLGVEWERP